MQRPSLYEIQSDSRLRSESGADLSLFKFPPEFNLPPKPIRSFSTFTIASEANTVSDTTPDWLKPHVDWESRSRFGHLWLKMFAFIARLSAIVYWLFSVPKIDDWAVLCLFYHAGPGLLGMETAAILPYIFSNVPFRTVSWFHDIAGIVLGTCSVAAIHAYSTEKVISSFMSLTVIPLIFDLILHVSTLPRYVGPIY